MQKVKEISFFNKLKNVPVAFSGIALGIGGLGNAWMNLYPEQLSWLKFVTIPIVILLITLLFTKNVIHPKTLANEMKEPLLSSFLPTFTMCLMLIAGFVGSFDKTLISAAQVIALIIMCSAVGIQFVLIFIFVFFIVKKHDWHNHPMYGSWFVPTVGLITACTVAPNFSLLPALFFEIIWFIGFAFFVLTFVPITYSLLFKTKANNERFPSIAVYFAPANLVPSGFMNTFWFANGKIINDNGVAMFQYSGNFDPMFIFVMLLIILPFGLVMSFFLYLFLIKIFKNKFSFIFASLSFPLAISATTMILIYKMTMSHSFQVVDNLFIKAMSWSSYILSNIFVICATIVILYVFFRMIYLLIKIFINTEKPKINNTNNKTSVN